jgi:hypothetical protein
VKGRHLGLLIAKAGKPVAYSGQLLLKTIHSGVVARLLYRRHGLHSTVCCLTFVHLL